MKIELKQRKDETLHGRRLYLVSQWKALRNSWWSNERIICNTLCNIVRQFYISRRLSRPLSLILLAQSLLLPLSSSWPPPSSSSLTPPPPHDLINVDGIVCLSLHRRYWSQMVATVINWSFQNIQDYLVGILKLHLKGPLLIVICHNARSKVEKAQTFLSHFNEMNQCGSNYDLFPFICINHLGSTAMYFGMVFSLLECVCLPFSCLPFYSVVSSMCLCVWIAYAKYISNTMGVQCPQ